MLECPPLVVFSDIVVRGTAGGDAGVPDSSGVDAVVNAVGGNAGGGVGMAVSSGVDVDVTAVGG